MGGDKKVYTFAECSEFNNRDKCWLVIRGKVILAIYKIVMAVVLFAYAPLGIRITYKIAIGVCGLTSKLGQQHGNLSHGLTSNSATNYVVYDVTKFLDDHPGGDDVILSSTGKDATNDFEDVGHSTSAYSMMDDFYIGDIDTTTIPSKVTYTPPKQPHYNQDKTPEFIIKILQVLVPLLILGVAVGIRFYTKSAQA
ncbi:hypothetical protein F8388_009102 [Cannabis sativa]|uniref:Cytochrome b5 heme-binding domain-containing protein n=1 Tax=Cannabis sativa TaxID=3483 RepID=A0A7J6GJN0_CANSA|nr:hypothetical protein F8388_009102 [Cannabis sativa]